MAVGIRHADHVAPSIRKKLTIASPTSGGRSVGIVRSRIQTMEFSFSLVYEISNKIIVKLQLNCVTRFCRVWRNEIRLPHKRGVMFLSKG
jgi:hypothetical protein